MTRGLRAAGLLCVLALSTASLPPGSTWGAASAPIRAADLPPRLSDQAFWRLITEFSEPDGYFQSDNFVSNETLFQTVIPDLKKRTHPGAYLGVGPDQNFTYIVALQPHIAFIVDIRRQNLLEHLIYKAVFEMSSDRADFLSHLFSRKRPAGLGPASTPLELLEASFNALPDRALYETNLTAIFARLAQHGFGLTPDDKSGVAHVYGMFFTAGPAITYSSSAQPNVGGFGRGGRGGGRGMPTYAAMMLTDDGHGLNRSYLGSEANFAALKAFERDNLLVPVVGNFAGDKALRSVGRYLMEHGETVTAFYLSNVEQYLFQDPDNWRRFYASVAKLPLDGASTFIRSCFQGCGAGGGFGGGYPFGGRGGTMRSAQLLQPVADLLADLRAGRIATYRDVLSRSTPPSSRN
jgi:hypothetical protein